MSSAGKFLTKVLLVSVIGLVMSVLWNTAWSETNRQASPGQRIDIASVPNLRALGGYKAGALGQQFSGD